jgi:hypothetical protein
MIITYGYYKFFLIWFGWILNLKQFCVAFGRLKDGEEEDYNHLDTSSNLMFTNAY